MKFTRLSGKYDESQVRVVGDILVIDGAEYEIVTLDVYDDNITYEVLPKEQVAEPNNELKEPTMAELQIL